MTSQSTTVRELPPVLAATAPTIQTVLDLCIEREALQAPGVLTDEDAVWPSRLRRILRACLTHWGCTRLLDDAELLLTELVTNALRHPGSNAIRVRVELCRDLCWIEVDDGCASQPEPRDASLFDESGRGLLLVDAISHSWGISRDGTATWCTLLNDGGPVIEPTVEVVHERALPLPPNSGAPVAAQIGARTLLTVMGWSGPHDVAVKVLYVLVRNAVEHGLTEESASRRLEAWLRITGRGELLIDVQDHTRDFPDFGRAVQGELGRGLLGARNLGATLSWFPDEQGQGKTVRATLQPGPVDP